MMLQWMNYHQEEQSSVFSKVTLHIKVRGVKYKLDWSEIVQKIVIETITKSSKNNFKIDFEREPDNKHDENAIKVLVVESLSSNHGSDSATTDGVGQELNTSNTTSAVTTKIQIGFVAQEQAKILAPLLDQGFLRWGDDGSKNNNIEIPRCFKTKITLKVTAELSEAVDPLELKDGFGTRIINVKRFHKEYPYTSRDLEQSYSSPYLLRPGNPGIKMLPWNPNDGSVKTARGGQLRLSHTNPKLTTTSSKKTKDNDLNLEFGWPNSDPIVTISADERNQAKAWPPSDDLLSKLGLGGSNDKNWWNNVAGMRPPSKWTVSGAYNLIGGGEGDSNTAAPVSLSSPTQVQFTNDTLDGKVHGVTNIWTEDTLEAISDLMHSPHFWLHRKNESFIRALGGPYVLGQKQDDLHLILGAQHNELTSRICCGHNLVYTAVNLEYPVSPGFNTLIFGLNLLGSGFHYHQDSMGELAGKNAPML